MAEDISLRPVTYRGQVLLYDIYVDNQWCGAVKRHDLLREQNVKRLDGSAFCDHSDLISDQEGASPQ